MRELHDNIDVKRGISPAAATTDNTAFVSQILDMQGLSSAEFIILCGALADADATFTVLAEEGENPGLSDNTAIDDRDLLGLGDAGGLRLLRRQQGVQARLPAERQALQARHDHPGQQHRQCLRRRRLGD